jgi:hypothetical protein
MFRPRPNYFSKSSRSGIELRPSGGANRYCQFNLIYNLNCSDLREDFMNKLDRRSALAIGLAAASAAVVKPAASQTMDPLAGKDETPWPGVVVRSYGESSSLIPGFKTVSMRDVIMQPGSKTAAPR